MAGWLKRVDGSGLDSFKTPSKVQKKDPLLDLESSPASSAKRFVKSEQNNQQDDCDKVKSLFNEFLSAFLQQIFGPLCFRPLPPRLGDGQPLDLFKLYLNVRRKGGYERVSENGLWGSVAKECGFDSSVGLALKLVYAKYLDTLNIFLERIAENRDSMSETKDSSEDSFGGCLMDLESGLKGFLAEFSGKKKKDGEYVNEELKNSESDFDCDEKLPTIDDHCDSVKWKGKIDDIDKKNAVKNVDRGGIESFSQKGNASDKYKDVVANVGETGNIKGDYVVSDSTAVKEDFFGLKRKRECFSAMLNWISRVAKNPCDPVIGSLPESSKWKYHTSDNVWKQILLVREAMLLKKNVHSSDHQLAWQKKQKMHPIMYDDHAGSERQRFSQRILSAKDSLKESRGHLFESSSSGTLTDDGDSVPDSTADSIPDFLAEHPRKNRVPVGPNYQADVPEWTAETHESDLKWLGTRIWPLERVEQNKYLIERERIGKGRHDSCGCQFPGSNDCVRFHVSEKRMRVRLELGPAFYWWKFDSMGEEIACSWTKEEERKFHDIVKSNPLSLGKNFWNELVKSFPRKCRESMVSYYFNVFILRQRGHQNRSTPDDIYSDEESALGSEGVKTPGFIFCSPKKANLNF